MGVVNFAAIFSPDVSAVICTYNYLTFIREYQFTPMFMDCPISPLLAPQNLLFSVVTFHNHSF
jgi:hypothetical protein